MLSAAEKLALLPKAAREEALNELAMMFPGGLEQLLQEWAFWGRPEQQEPKDPWSTWYIETGRGWGKTRTACQTIHKKVYQGVIQNGAVVHRTAGDVRDVCIEGKSGLLACAPKGHLPKYEPSKRRVTWDNGTVFTTFSAEEPDLLRGPEHDFGWGEEFATWKGITGIDGATAFDNLRFSMRGTSNPAGPQLILTTTPKRVKSVRTLHEDVKKAVYRIVVTKGSLRDNIGNLDPIYVAQIMAKYAGTALGEQEIDGVLAKTVEGAIFTEAMFEASRITDLNQLPVLTRPLVAVDPSSGDGSGDECGISVQALSEGTLPTELRQGTLSVVRNLRHGYVLDDASMSGPPDAWADRVAETCEKWETNVVIAEGNQGGQMVKSVLRARNPALKVRIVHARHGKDVRAQPVAALFAQKRWHLVGEFGELEDQSTTWVPVKDKDSPDRMDAMVWGATALEPAVARGERSVAMSAGALARNIG